MRARNPLIAIPFALAFLTPFAFAAPFCRTDERRLGPYNGPRPYPGNYRDNLHIGYSISSGGQRAAMLDGVQGPWYDALSKDITCTADGRFAYAARRDNHWFVVVDGIEGAAYDGMSLGPIFSYDGRRVAYIAWRGSRRIAVVDGVELRYPPDTFFPSLVFSSRGHRLAYVGRSGGKQFVVVDGFAGQPYDKVWLTYSCFSYPDSRHVLYTARNEGKSFVVVDGIAGRPYDSIDPESLCMLSDSRHIRFSAHRAKDSFYVVDGIERRWPGWERAYFLRFSPDGRRSAYLLSKGDPFKGGKFAVVVDGVVGPGYDAEGSLVFSADSRHFAYSTKRGADCVVVRDGVEGPRFPSRPSSFSDIHDMVFSPDDRHLAYPVPVGEKRAMVVDDVRGPVYASVGYPQFTPDSRHFVYSAEKGGQPERFWGNSAVGFHVAPKTSKFVLVFDGVESPEYDSVGWVHPCSGMQGRRMIYAAQRAGKWFLVTDGVEGCTYDDLRHLALSPDERRFAYAAKRGSRWMMVIDGAEGLRYDEILGVGRLANDGAIEYLAVDAGTLYRVHQSPPS